MQEQFKKYQLRERVKTILIVEGPSKNNPELLTGRTDSNKVVIFEGSKELIDTIIDLKIISEHMWYLKGQIIQLKNNYNFGCVEFHLKRGYIHHVCALAF